MIRFLLLWVFVSAQAYAIIYIATKRDRKKLRKYLLRAAIAALVALVFIAALFFINNVSGV